LHHPQNVKKTPITNRGEEQQRIQGKKDEEEKTSGANGADNAPPIPEGLPGERGF